MRNSFKQVIGLSALILLGCAVFAFAQESQPNADPAESQNEASTEVAAEEPPQPEVNPDATFTPTEEISEDQPVAFPVDI